MASQRIGHMLLDAVSDVALWVQLQFLKKIVYDLLAIINWLPVPLSHRITVVDRQGSIEHALERWIRRKADLRTRNPSANHIGKFSSRWLRA